MTNIYIAFFFTIDTSSPIITPKVEREEPEKIKKWREEQKIRLEEKGITYFILTMVHLFGVRGTLFKNNFFIQFCKGHRLESIDLTTITISELFDFIQFLSEGH